MKKIFLLLSIILTSVSAMGQDTYEWAGLEFTIPAGCEVTESTEDAFVAQGKGVSVSLSAFEDDSVTEEQLVEACLQMAKNAGYENMLGSGDLVDDSLKGGYVEFEKDGGYAIFCGMFDEESGANILAIVFYAEGFEEKANSVVNSFCVAE